MSDRLLEIGRIAKPHGLRGEVIVDLITDRTERMTPGGTLVAGDRSLRIVAARPHQHRRWIVAVEGVSDRGAAEQLAGRTLYGEPIDDPEALWVDDLVGARVVDKTGVDRGTVVAVVENPAHDLLELDSGALVPVPFVVGVADGVVDIDPPDGLFDDDA
jgi:16S rRNA processing protein RimM